jgi:hypothetical protein
MLLYGGGSVGVAAWQGGRGGRDGGGYGNGTRDNFLYVYGMLSNKSFPL